MTIPTWQLLAQIDRIHEMQALRSNPESKRRRAVVGAPVTTALSGDGDDPSTDAEAAPGGIVGHRSGGRVPAIAKSVESLHRLIARR